MNTVESASLTRGPLEKFQKYFSAVLGVHSPWSLQFAFGRAGVGAHLHTHKVSIGLLNFWKSFRTRQCTSTHIN